ncbi:hypothetical protein KCU92_g43, partial [Aureobasidium melanogenum]
MDVPGVALGHKVQHLIFWNGLAQQFGVGVEAVFAVALVTPATTINQATSIASTPFAIVTVMLRTVEVHLGRGFGLVFWAQASQVINARTARAEIHLSAIEAALTYLLMIYRSCLLTFGIGQSRIFAGEPKPSTMTVVFLSTRRSARESSGAAAAVLLTVFCLVRFAVHMRINGFVLALFDDRFEIPGNHFAHINFRMTQSSSAATDQALQLPLSLLRLVGRMDVLHGLGYLCREVQLLSNPAHHLLFHSTRAQQLVDSNRFGLLHRGRSRRLRQSD